MADGTNRLPKRMFIKALTGQGLTIPLDKLYEGTITAWMKKDPKKAAYRTFGVRTNDDNKTEIFLTKSNASDTFENDVLVEEIAGKWYFDVRFVPTGGTEDDEKVIFGGKILFYDNITD